MKIGIADKVAKYQKGGPIKGKEEVKKLQTQLQAQGLYKGKIDGIYGPLTDAAYKQSVTVNPGTYFPTVTGSSPQRETPIGKQQYLKEHGILPEQEQSMLTRSKREKVYKAVTANDMLRSYQVTPALAARVATNYDRFAEEPEFENKLYKAIATPEVLDLNTSLKAKVKEAHDYYKNSGNEPMGLSLGTLSNVEDYNLFDRLDLLSSYQAEKEMAGETALSPEEKAKLESVIRNKDLRKASDKHRDYYISKAQGDGGREVGEADTSHEDSFRMFLGLPQKYGTYDVAEYSPGISKDKNKTYYKANSKESREGMLKMARYLKEGESRIFGAPGNYSPEEAEEFDSAVVANMMQQDPKMAMISRTDPLGALGQFKISRGRDDKGEYISYYDNWDLNPVGAIKDVNFVGKPFEVYDRVYLPKTEDNAQKPKAYQNGGEIKIDKPKKVVKQNLQKVGDVNFDSNQARPTAEGYYIVKDLKTGKDFGVVRNADNGSYEFFDRTKANSAFLEQGQLDYQMQNDPKVKKAVQIAKVIDPKQKFVIASTHRDDGTSTRGHYTPMTGNIGLRTVDSKAENLIVQEASHSYQFKKLGGTDRWDFSHNSKPDGYTTPGQIEYSAHKQIQPILQKIQRQTLNSEEKPPVPNFGRLAPKTGYYDYIYSDNTYTVDEKKKVLAAYKHDTDEFVFVKRNPDGTYKKVDETYDLPRQVKDKMKARASLSNPEPYVTPTVTMSGKKVKLATGGELGPSDPPNWQTANYRERKITFDSNQGTPRDGYPNRYTVLDKDSLMYYEVERDNTGAYKVVEAPRFTKEYPGEAEMKAGRLKEGAAMKAGAKPIARKVGPRFREQATGGEIPYTPIGLPVTPDSIKAQKDAAKTTFGQQLGNFVSNPVVQGIASVIPGVGGLAKLGKSIADVNTQNNNYAATGGALDSMDGVKIKGGNDVRLSDNATQVKGSPETTDANQYIVGDTRVHLDHDEVVKGNKVLSNKLINPLTGKTFAQDAAKSERLVEKLSKRNSPVDRTTIKRLNNDTEKLYEFQETLATQMGLRKTQPGEIMNASGGPIDVKYVSGGPVPKDLNVKEFQAWLASSGVNIAADGKWGPTTEAAYSQYKDAWNLRNHPLNIAEANDITDRMGTTAPMNDNAERAAAISLQPKSGPLAPLANTLNVNRNLPYTTDPITGQLPNEAFSTQPPTLPSNSRIPNQRTGIDKLLTKLGVIPQVDAEGNPMPSTATPPINGENAEGSTSKESITPGTALQGIAAASQMIRSFGKGPANKSYQVTTPITRSYYSADQALQQNQTNYAQSRNAIDAGSVNTRRALNNSLYASKLGSDNQVISQTNDMNRAANIDYENRLGQRQGQNIQLAQYKNELDARDLGAQNNAKDVAFNTLSNFGRALDDKRSTTETLGLLKELYPDVYGRINKKKNG